MYIYIYIYSYCNANMVLAFTFLPCLLFCIQDHKEPSYFVCITVSYRYCAMNKLPLSRARLTLKMSSVHLARTSKLASWRPILGHFGICPSEFTALIFSINKTVITNQQLIAQIDLQQIVSPYQDEKQTSREPLLSIGSWKTTAV